MQVAPDYVPVPPIGYGGIERIVYELTEQLVKQGHDVILYALPGSKSSAKIIEYNHVADDRKIVKFVKDTLPKGVDIIHDHTHGTVINALDLEIPYVSTIHIPWYNWSRNPVFACNEMRKSLASGEGFVVFHGLNSEEYPIKEKNEGYLLFLGRLVWEKGIHHAIEVQKQSNLPLLIAGPSDVVEAEKYSDYANSILDEVNNNPNIHYVGEVAGEEKIKLLQNAYCLLFPSDPEAFGLVMIEALFCGTPVLGFSHGSVPEVLDGFPELICKNTIEMVEKIHSNNFPSSTALREYATTHFTSYKMAKNYLKIYNHLISSGKNNSEPLVSVLLPVYNSKNYIEEAIDSILNQSFPDFELLLLDDGSKDGSTEILYRYEQKDSRIKVIKFEENTGLINVLNYGLSIAKGKYIARMDSDDISIPERFSIQVDFMEKNPDIGLCGGAARVIGTEEVWWQASDPEEVKCQLLFHCCFIHPTIMIRKKVLDDYNIRYSHNAPHAEDYELYRELSKVTQLGNVTEILLLYRFHSNQVSTRFQTIQHQSANKIKYLQLLELGISPTSEQMETHLNLKDQHISENRKFNWLQLLINQNKFRHVYQSDKFIKVIVQHSNVNLVESENSRPNKTICFILLVHEDIDLVYNLIENVECFCPNSKIVIYNGGKDQTLCENIDIKVCPTSRKLEHGYTTIHLLETMEWLEEIGMEYDHLINLDSDALFIRKGYEDFVNKQMEDADYMGVDLRIAEETYFCGKQLKTEAYKWDQLFDLQQLYGVFNVGQVMSRKFIKALINSEKKLLLKRYLLETNAFGTDELVYVNMAKELGFKLKKYPSDQEDLPYEPIGYDMDKWMIRFRPHFTIQELIHGRNNNKNRWLCHPIYRTGNDLARQLVYSLQKKSTELLFCNEQYPWYQSDTAKYSISKPIISHTGHQELVARVGNSLIHYYKEESNWYASETIVKGVKGNPLLYESNYQNFEVIAVNENGWIEHWWRDNHSQFLTWNGPNLITNEDVVPLFLGQLEGKHIFVAEKGDTLFYWIRDEGNTWNWHGPYS